MAQVVSVNISEKKGMRKHPVPYIDVRLRHGIVGDAHAGDWHRQISLLAVESVDAMRADCPVPLDSGVFAENINTAGIDLRHLPVGTLLRVGPALLRVTQIGKECHSDCAIRRTAGRCVMRRTASSPSSSRRGGSKRAMKSPLWRNLYEAHQNRGRRRSCALP